MMVPKKSLTTRKKVTTSVDNIVSTRKKRGRPPKNAAAMSNAQRSREKRWRRQVDLRWAGHVLFSLIEVRDLPEKAFIIALQEAKGGEQLAIIERTLHALDPNLAERWADLMARVHEYMPAARVRVKETQAEVREIEAGDNVGNVIRGDTKIYPMP